MKTMQLSNPSSRKGSRRFWVDGHHSGCTHESTPDDLVPERLLPNRLVYHEKIPARTRANSTKDSLDMLYRQP